MGDLLSYLINTLVIVHVGINSYILGVNSENIPNNKVQALSVFLFIISLGFLWFVSLRLCYEIKHSKRFADLRFWILLNLTNTFADLSKNQIRLLENDKHENVVKQWARVKKKYNY